MAESPTRSAESNFQKAGSSFIRTWVKSPGEEFAGLPFIGSGLQDMSNGLKDLSVAVRATYQKLEEIEKLIRSQGSSFR